jgi:opacity protein-like surface antigen
MSRRWLALALSFGAAALLAVGAANAFAQTNNGDDDSSDNPNNGLGLGGRWAHAKNLDTDETSNMGGAMARLRSNILGLEGAIDYRKEDVSAGAQLKSWPVTASVLLYPVPQLYGLAGLGWYNTTLDFPDDSGIDNQTDSQLGYHFGVGAEVPVAHSVSITGDGRWQFVDYEFDDIPETVGEVGANTFTMNLGLLFYLR